MPQKEKALERVGRESLIDFFEHLIGETEAAEDGEEMAEEGQRDEAGRARRRGVLAFSSIPFLSGGLRRSLQCPVPVLPR